ncbi:hypothetical protein ACFJGV_08435 [Cnuibacter sp. UC19_7]|uniref:hypothetical protein n=1 Tax=Cnuibacter sp. UC19_7 TaxID=3350166 RepID=UPI00366C462C
MDDTDEVSGSGAAPGEVPWEYDFTLARVRRPRLLRPPLVGHATRGAGDRGDVSTGAVAQASPSRDGADAALPPIPALPPNLASVEDTVRLSEGVPAALTRSAAQRADAPANPPAPAPAPANPPAPAPAPANPPAPAPAPANAPAPAHVPAPAPAHPHTDVHRSPVMAPAPAHPQTGTHSPPQGSSRTTRRRRWSAARTELVVKVTCGIALVGGTAALVVLAFNV